MEQKIASSLEFLEYIPRQSICFISKGRLENVLMREIIHIEKVSTDTLIRTRQQEFITYHSLQELLRELPENEFARVHRSHIVSLAAVDGFRGDYLRLDKRKVPLTEYYKKQLKIKLGRILEQQYAGFQAI